MRNPRRSPAPSFAPDVPAFGRRLHALLMRARRIKCFCGGAKTMLFKGKRDVGDAPTATFQRYAASAASQSGSRRASHAAVRSDGRVPRAFVGSTPSCCAQDASSVLPGAAKRCCSRGKKSPRPLGLRRTAHVRSDAAPPRARALRLPAPAQLPRAQRTCNLAVRRQSMPATPASGLCPKRAIQHPKQKAFGRIRAQHEQFQ